MRRGDWRRKHPGQLWNGNLPDPTESASFMSTVGDLSVRVCGNANRPGTEVRPVGLMSSLLVKHLSCDKAILSEIQYSVQGPQSLEQDSEFEVGFLDRFPFA